MFNFPSNTTIYYSIIPPKKSSWVTLLFTAKMAGSLFPKKLEGREAEPSSITRNMSLLFLHVLLFLSRPESSLIMLSQVSRIESISSKGLPFPASQADSSQRLLYWVICRTSSTGNRMAHHCARNNSLNYLTSLCKA